MTIKNKSLLTFIIVMVMMVGLFLINTLKIEATVNYGLEQSQVLDDPNVVIRGTDTGGNNDTANAEALLEAATTSSSASWKNATNYYIVYPDAASAGSLQDGDTTSVTYEGVTVDAIVIIGNDFKAGSLVSAAKADTTIFLKSGNYVNLSKNAKGAFQLNFSNLSVIGVDGPGTVTIHSEKSGTLNWSIGIGGTNVLLQNLIFDGDNAGMANQSNSSGYYFLKILQNATNITFDNVTVQNIPSSGSGFYNVAINVIYAKNVLFNNVSLINLASKTGYSVIQVNNSSRAVYFNNLSLDNVKSGNSASGGSNYPFIKIEDGSTVTSELNQVSVYFTGDLTFANMDDQYKKIWIQNYKYDTVAFPSDVYRYAQLRNQNGSWTSNYIYLSATMPDTNSQYAIFDLKDNTFVLKHDDAISDSAQMQTIINTLSFIRYIKGDSAAEEYNVKYEVKDTLTTIDLPNIVPSIYASRYAGYYEDIHLNIIPVADEANTVDNREVFDFIDGTSQINLPVENATESRYKIFNIDFDNTASLSLQEVLQGIDGSATLTDPYYSLYGTSDNLTYNEYLVIKDATVDYADDTTFQDCIFTSLVAKIALSDISDPIQTTHLVGDKVQLAVNFTDTNDNSYSKASISSLDLNKDTANDNVPNVKWFSTDTSVAIVDANGKVNLVGVGSATIVAKAIDVNNDGEIEKPFATYEISVSSVNINYNLNATDATRGNGVASEVLAVDTKLSDAAHYADAPTRDGYNFVGWYLDQEGNTLADDTLMGRTDVSVYAKWEKVVHINYDLNATDATRGNGVASEVLETGSKLSDAAHYSNDPIRAGYTFEGWYLDKDGKTLADNTIIGGNDVTVYAKWTKIPNDETVNVTYNSNGTKVSSPIDNVNYNIGDKVKVQAPDLSKLAKNETFLGWALNPDGTGKLYQPGDTFTITGDTTLYAIVVTDIKTGASPLFLIIGSLTLGSGVILYQVRRKLLK